MTRRLILELSSNTDTRPHTLAVESVRKKGLFHALASKISKLFSEPPQLNPEINTGDSIGLLVTRQQYNLLTGANFPEITPATMVIYPRATYGS